VLLRLGRGACLPEGCLDSGAVYDLGMVMGEANYLEALESLTSIHNETCNIYTHLIGVLLIPSTPSSLSKLVNPREGRTVCNDVSEVQREPLQSHIPTPLTASRTNAIG
jgi:hypothetical protein